MEAKVFERCFRQWMGRLVGVAEGVVAFDGKTVLHMVSAYATALGVSLGREGGA